MVCNQLPHRYKGFKSLNMASRFDVGWLIVLLTLCSSLVLGAKNTRCYYTKIHKLFTANCSEMDFIQVPQDLKNSTEVLDLSDNKIKRLTNSSFIYYTDIQILYLSDNRILSIEEGAFVPLTDLRTLDLSSNALRKLPHYLPPSLIKLYLAANPIGEVNYCNANSLQFLSLADNDLDPLPSLGLMPSLVQLVLTDSRITQKLTPDFLAPMCRLQLLQLPRDLFREEGDVCHCHTLNAWIKQRHITIDYLNCSDVLENHPECNTTASPRAMELHSACLQEWESMNMPYMALFFGSAVLLSAAIIIFLVWWTRRRRDQAKTSKTPIKTSSEPEKTKEVALLS